MDTFVVIGIVLFVVLVLIPLIVSSFLRNVGAGTIRMVSWLGGGTRIYRGPGKSYEIPLLTTGTTLSSKAINVDLDITDQTADLDAGGVPRPIKVRVLASAIVSVGDTDTLITTAANRFFSKGEADQLAILTDLLASAARRAINLLTHDQLFSAKSAPTPVKALETPASAVLAAEEDDDPLAIIIRKACSKELTDLGLIFNSLNIKVVQSEVADARRRQSAAEAQANADIVTTQQGRRSREARLKRRGPSRTGSVNWPRPKPLTRHWSLKPRLNAKTPWPFSAARNSRPPRLPRPTPTPRGCEFRLERARTPRPSAFAPWPRPTPRACVRCRRPFSRAVRATCATVRWRCCRSSPR